MLKRKEDRINLRCLVVTVNVVDVVDDGQLVVAVEPVDVFHDVLWLAIEATRFLPLKETGKQMSATTLDAYSGKEQCSTEALDRSGR
jgi:hypothetical protein